MKIYIIDESGNEHRLSQPYVIYNNDYKKYYNTNFKLHRINGPAIEYASGAKEWYINGKLHREDGSAIELADGTRYWYINGKLHRENGPAIEYANGDKHWYYNDVLIGSSRRGFSQKDFDEHIAQK